MENLTELTPKTGHFRRAVPFFCLLLLFPALYFLVESEAFIPNADLLSLGITIDLVFVIPILFFLLIRKKNVPKTVVVPVFVLGVVVATFILPEANQFYLSLVKTWLVPLVELTVFSFVIWQVRIGVKSYKEKKSEEMDFYAILKETCHEQFPRGVAGAIVMELSVFYYGFIRWRRGSLQSNHFTYHKESPARVILGILIFLVLAETFVFHILLMNWSLVAAWILTGLSIYSGVQVFGVLRSLAFRPHIIEDQSLQLRFGIMNEATIDLVEIEEIFQSTKELEEGTFQSLSPLGNLDSHNVILRVKNEQTIEGLYGTEKKFKVLVLNLDQPTEFVVAVNSKMSENQN